MKDFADRFHLSHPDKGFNVLPWDPDDAAAYFGERRLNDHLQRRIEASYALGKPPKIYLFGRWGSGKTHHLYHLKYVLENKGAAGVGGFVVRLFSIECEDATPFQYLHRKMLNSLGLDLIKNSISDFLMKQGSNRTEAQRRIFSSNNLIVATQVLSIGDDQLAWRWLSGMQLSTQELRSLNVTSNLEDTSELTDVLIRIGRLLATEGKRAVFLVDEAEGLKNVKKPNAVGSWHDGLKNLADNVNNSIGFVLATHEDSNSPAAEFLTSEDIKRRITTENMLVLEPYSDPNEVQSFLRDLIDARVRLGDLADLPSGVTTDSYPFSLDAADLFRQELLAGVSPTPSKVIESVSECALASHLRNVDFVDVDVVRDVVPRVVAAV